MEINRSHAAGRFGSVSAHFDGFETLLLFHRIRETFSQFIQVRFNKNLKCDGSYSKIKPTSESEENIVASSKKSERWT